MRAGSAFLLSTAAVVALAAALTGAPAFAAAARRCAMPCGLAEAHEQAIVAEYVTLLSMPNVATNVADVDKNAAYIEEQLRRAASATRLLGAEPGTPPRCSPR